MSRKLNILIIGTGTFATSTYLPVLQELSDKFQIVACCNRSIEKAKQFAEKANLSMKAVYTEVDEALKHPNIDVAAILVPVQYNLELITKAVNAGKHVIVEKPIAHNLQDALKVVELSRSTDKVILVAENFGYRTYLHTISDIIRSGAEIVELLGRPDEISAFASQFYEVHGAEDIIALTTKMQSGVVGTFVLSVATAKPAKTHFRIYGTKGIVNITQSQTFDESGSILCDQIRTKIYQNKGEVTELEKSSGLGVLEEWIDLYTAIMLCINIRI